MLSWSICSLLKKKKGFWPKLWGDNFGYGRYDLFPEDSQCLIQAPVY